MKSTILFSIIFLLAINCKGQVNQANLEVLLIGAAHEYNPRIKQDLNSIHDKIRLFRPDAFLGEWLSIEDEKALKSYGHKGWVMRRYELLKSKNDIPDSTLEKEIIRKEKLIKSDSKNLKLRVDLAVAYYLNWDQGNGYFQMWKVAKYLEQNPSDTAVFNYAKSKFFSEVVDNIDKAIRPYIHDEYDYIAHPMMQEMGMDNIYPIDSQRWDGQGSNTWRMADSVLNANIELHIRDTISEFGKQVYTIHNSYKNRMKELEAEATRTYGQNHYTEALNGPQYTERLYQISMIPEAYRGLPFFPEELYNKKLESWKNRNKDMCDNTLKQAKLHNLKKVVIVVGANHAKIMHEIFNQMGIKVRNIND